MNHTFLTFLRRTNGVILDQHCAELSPPWGYTLGNNQFLTNSDIPVSRWDSLLLVSSERNGHHLWGLYGVLTIIHRYSQVYSCYSCSFLSQTGPRSRGNPPFSQNCQINNIPDILSGLHLSASFHR